MQSLFSTRNFITLALLFLSTQTFDVLGQQSPQQQARVPELETPQTETATGIVRNFTQAPTGEADGFELDNGTTVHYPSLLHAKVANTIQKNSSVRVTGLVWLRRRIRLETSQADRSTDDHQPYHWFDGGSG